MATFNLTFKQSINIEAKSKEEAMRIWMEMNLDEMLGECDPIYAEDILDVEKVED